VDYRQGSSLVYHELLGGVAVKSKNGLGLIFHVTHMRVDDTSSRQAGRELWGMPKELARFHYNYSQGQRTFEASVRDEAGHTLATGDFSSIIGLPRLVRVPMPFPTLQLINAQPHHIAATFWSALQLCRGGMRIPADSELATLGVVGRKPLLSFAGLGFRLHLEAARPIKSKDLT
jgi:hypothetical protein